MTRTKIAVKVRFQRGKGGRWEDGVGVGAGDGDLDVIVDFHGQTVPIPWDFKAEPYEGFIRFNLEGNIPEVSIKTARRRK